MNFLVFYHVNLLPVVFFLEIATCFCSRYPYKKVDYIQKIPTIPKHVTTFMHTRIHINNLLGIITNLCLKGSRSVALSDLPIYILYNANREKREIFTD